MMPAHTAGTGGKIVDRWTRLCQRVDHKAGEPCKTRSVDQGSPEIPGKKGTFQYGGGHMDVNWVPMPYRRGTEGGVTVVEKGQ